jgi:hypothetical protein
MILNNLFITFAYLMMRNMTLKAFKLFGAHLDGPYIGSIALNLSISTSKAQMCDG